MSRAASDCSTARSGTRPGRPPPCSIPRATWPAIRLPRTVELPAGKYRCETTFGAEDLIALTGQDGLARSWLGGRIGVGPRGLELRLVTRRAASVAAALEDVLPAAAAVGFRGQLVCVRIARTKASGHGLLLPIGNAVEPSPGRREPESAAERRLHAVVDTLGLHVYSGRHTPTTVS